jgi:hypothetical protein
MADNGKMSFKRPQAPTKNQMREMLAQAVRNTQPELNHGQASEQKKPTPKRRSRR